MFLKRMFYTIIFSITFFNCTFLYASDAYIDSFKLTPSKESILISFNVENAFRSDIVEAINSSIPTTFTFYVKLYEDKENWKDKHLKTWKIQHTVDYDSLKKQYKIYFDNNEKVLLIEDLEQMKQLMSGSESLVLNTYKSFEIDKKYKVKIKAELDKITLPFHLDYMFFFVSLWDFETEWKTEEFVFNE